MVGCWLRIGDFLRAFCRWRISTEVALIVFVSGPNNSTWTPLDCCLFVWFWDWAQNLQCLFVWVWAPKIVGGTAQLSRELYLWREYNKTPYHYSDERNSTIVNEPSCSYWRKHCVVVPMQKLSVAKVGRGRGISFYMHAGFAGLEHYTSGNDILQCVPKTRTDCFSSSNISASWSMSSILEKWSVFFLTFLFT